MMEVALRQMTLQSIVYKQNKRFAQSANDRRKPMNQAVFAPLPTSNSARTAYLHCIKDGMNIEIIMQRLIQFNDCRSSLPLAG